MEAAFSPTKSGNFESFNSDFFVEHTKILSGTGMRTEHYHDFYELYFYIGDGMKYFIDNKSFYVRKYDLILIDKFTYHRTSYNEKGYKERILFYLNESVFDMICNSGNDTLKKQLIGLFDKKKISFNEEFSKYFFSRIMNNILPNYYDKTNPAIGQLQAKLNILELLLEILKMDKKRSERTLDYILLKRIGEAQIHQVDFDIIEKHLDVTII